MIQGRPLHVDLFLSVFCVYYAMESLSLSLSLSLFFSLSSPFHSPSPYLPPFVIAFDIAPFSLLLSLFPLFSIAPFSLLLPSPYPSLSLDLSISFSIFPPLSAYLWAFSSLLYYNSLSLRLAFKRGFQYRNNHMNLCVCVVNP